MNNLVLRKDTAARIVRMVSDRLLTITYQEVIGMFMLAHWIFQRHTTDFRITNYSVNCYDFTHQFIL